MGLVNQVVVCKHFEDLDELADFLNSFIGYDSPGGQKIESIYSFQIVSTEKGFSLVAILNVAKPD